MKRLVPAFACAAMATHAALAAQSTDPSQVLNGMRLALGGDAPLQAVESFTLAGSQTRIADAGPPIDRRIEISCQLPDKYLRTFIRMGAAAGRSRSSMPCCCRTFASNAV